MTIRNIRRRMGATFSFFLVVFFVYSLSACHKNDVGPAVIWTNQVDFVSYAELFNTAQDKYRVVVVYKENPAELLPASGDDRPDLVIGPWLKNEKNRANFTPLDHLFDDLLLNQKIFYSSLLDQGNIQDRQYLIPVSFNIPAVIFSKDNIELIPDDFMLSLNQIRDAGAAFNRKSSANVFTAMGFSPRWTSEFLYITALLKLTNFREGGNSFTWNMQALSDTVTYLRDWTSSVNDSVSAENDFQFKYLYNPAYKLVSSERCLFAYMRTDDLFELPREKLENIDFRWVHENGVIPIIDETIYLGLYRKTNHTGAAEAFITWFFNENTQKALMERSEKMGVLNRNFGISGGFSSIKAVNERIFPSYYPLLLGHLPPQDALRPSNILPKKWEDMKEKIVIPYLKDAVSADNPDSVSTLDARIADWLRQN